MLFDTGRIPDAQSPTRIEGYGHLCQVGCVLRVPVRPVRRCRVPLHVRGARAHRPSYAMLGVVTHAWKEWQQSNSLLPEAILMNEFY